MATFTELLDVLQACDPMATAKAERIGATLRVCVEFKVGARALYFAESVAPGDMAALQATGARLVAMALEFAFGWCA